jgi:spermidine/putrescine transport system substrate-binding protein
MVSGSSSSTRTFNRLMIVGFYLVLFAAYVYGPLLYERMSKKKESLNIYTFFNVIDQNILRKFEEKTGIPVHVKYFDSNTGMRAQLEINGGSGYDIIAPSDYMVEILAESGFLQPIDTRKIKNYTDIDGRLLGREHDPENKYCVPVAWTIYGVGFNKEWLSGLKEPDSWTALFEPNKFWTGKEWEAKSKDYKICMYDEPTDVVFAASFYLYGNVSKFSAERLSGIKKLLLQQRYLVGSYGETNLPYYISGVCPVVMATSANMGRLMSVSPNFGFKIPKEGSIITIETLAITKDSKNVDLAHQFIDFAISEESSRASFNEYEYFPSNKKAYSEIDSELRADTSFFPDDKAFLRLHSELYRNISIEEINNLWIDVKSRKIEPRP